MSDAPTPPTRPPSPAPQVVTTTERPAAVVRGSIPAGELPDFFDRSFAQLAEAVAAQGVTVAGPAFGLYHGPPGETVELEVGFTIEGSMEAHGDVEPGSLPGGRAARMVHHGSFDGLAEAWEQLGAFIRAQDLAPGPLMWEVYVTEPSPDMDPADLRTELWWPVTGR